MHASAIVGSRAVVTPRAAVAKANKVAPSVRPASTRFVVAPTQRTSLKRSSSSLVARASFDEQLASWADKFEKSENKVAVAGWISLAAFAYFHLLIIAGKGILGGFFVGFPLEAIGAASLFYIVPRYVIDKKSVVADAGEVVKDVAKRLPGL